MQTDDKPTPESAEAADEAAVDEAAGSAPKRTFEVLVVAYRSVIVEAEDEEEATEIVAEECHSFDWEIDEWKLERELKTADEIESAKRHGAKTVDEW